ncbi:hypothetical protein Val02_06720 [Virgisporangium aliadipatigenens]|uniref:DUF4132 domain-containing protein n=1 Tax=Virgisporangium aliadipatigenens TaxID=741659 RepID=A0A8J3YEZ7_9ACTN|nr:DUF4132 domain-containing protein [Virgisporangium aliadipatigenens]GIJ43786.1 hypothetical protein Val02_06720 [Virgisporangium aliadipatigenens]
MAGTLEAPPELLAAYGAELAATEAEVGGGRSWWTGTGRDWLRAWQHLPVSRLSADRRRHVALSLVRAMSRSSYEDDDELFRRMPAMVSQVLDPALPWRADDVAFLVHEGRALVREPSEELPTALVRALRTVVAALDAEGVARVEPLVSAFCDAMSSRCRGTQPESLRVEVTALRADAVGEGRTDVVPPHLLHGGDLYGPAARELLGDLLIAPGVPAVLSHCAALDRPVPTKAWRAQFARLLAAAPGAVPAARALLELFVEHARRVEQLHHDAESLVRGLLWVLADRDDEWATPLLADVAVQGCAAYPPTSGVLIHPRIGNAAVGVLAGRAGQVPLGTLARLSTVVRNRALHGRVVAALETLGAARGWSLAEVMEQAVDDHGLDPAGEIRRAVGEYEATVRLVPGAGRATLTFTRAGRPVRTPPRPIREEAADLKALARAVDKTLAAERARVESLLSTTRTWAFGEWASRCCAHPVTGAIARTLVWEVRTGDGPWRAGLPVHVDGGWRLVDRAGAPHAGERVRLWHPIRADLDEVRAWRDHVAAVWPAQPFKQVFREVYLLTPAEEETGTYSNRFAAHVLRYGQVAALIRARGWRANHLGPFDGGYNAEAQKEFAGAWRASFFIDAVEPERHRYEVRHCTTDRVRFARRDGAYWAEARLSDVPVEVFSEAMRDVDLFVGVTSVAADPAWVDGGDERFRAYRESTAFGTLSANAQVRAEALARLLPRTKLAAVVALDGRWLRVRGRRRTYRIHIGSGNILMEPNDEYLCIVPARGKGTSVQLPFDDDPILSVVLSKAFLLAADDRITDPTILAQIGRGPA